MQTQLDEAIAHWKYVSTVVRNPKNKADYKKLVAQLDKLLDVVGENEQHPLIDLVDVISSLISLYEAQHFPSPKVTGIDALKSLMQSHKLKQADLSEIGSQGVVSEILRGKRKLNIRQVRLLAKRFAVDPATFLDEE